MRPLFTVFLLVFVTSGLLAQKEHPYREFLHTDSTSKTYPVYFQLAYAVPVYGTINNAGTSFHLSFGINLARFVTEKFHLGIFGSYKHRELFSFSKYRRSFIGELDSGIDLQGLSTADSSLVSFFSSKIQERGALGGNGYYQYGISLYYPSRFCPMIKIYRELIFDLVDGYRYVSSYEDDWIYFGTKNAWGLSLSVNPVYLLKGEQKYPLTISFFGERLPFRDMKLNDLPLENFVSDSFLEKNKYAYRFGLLIGIELY